jgi:outer membrane protein TolC
VSLFVALWVGGGLWAAPLALDEVLVSAEERSPLVARAAQELAKAEASRLGAQGAYDLGWSASGLAVPVGEYDYITAAAGLTQLTPLWGARMDAGYNLGVGGLPDYYGELATGPAGELVAGLTVPLLKGRAIDEERAALQAAGIRVQAAEAIVDTARLVVTREASLAYWRWVSAGRRLALAEELLQIAIARDAAITSRVAAGDLPEVDRLDNERIILERVNEMMVDGNFNKAAWDSSYSYTRTVTLSYEEPKSEAQ